MKYSVSDLRSILTTYGILIILIVLSIYFGIATSGQFFSIENIFNILKHVAVVGIISVGMTMVLLTGGIDLSVGSIAGVGTVLTAALLLRGGNVWLVILAVLAITTGIVVVNAFFIN